ncbi:hypothetical protein [Thermus tengchongensis]|uniref:hypothetical protein n=1 Tax=Thermus tengchongensis TaxID=1214928 RepID=UPI001F42E6E0|nr:hypothetical protein [Thermus tengchongensis]
MLPVRVGKRGKGYFPEARIVRGPRVMGETADNSFQALLGYAWMGVLDRAQRRFRLFQARKTALGSEPWPIGSPDEAEWVEVEAPPLPHPVEEIRHLALCFDQAARHVVAYERDEEIWIRQWDPLRGGYTMRGPFPGRDPVLIWDFEVGYFLPDSDVLLLHLSPDRTRVIMRVQRELYATPHVHQTLPSPGYLDQAVALPYQGEVLGSLEGDPDTTGLVLRTDPYPVRGEDPLAPTVFSPPNQWALIPVVVVRDVGEDGVAAPLSPPVEWAYIPIVLVRDLGTDTLSPGLSPPSAWTYTPVVIVRDLGQDQASVGASPPLSWSYQLVVVAVRLDQPPYTNTGYENLGGGAMSPPTAWSYGP